MKMTTLSAEVWYDSNRNSWLRLRRALEGELRGRHSAANIRWVPKPGVRLLILDTSRIEMNVCSG